jgi:hypothetical protein
VENVKNIWNKGRKDGEKLVDRLRENGGREIRIAG